MSEPEEFDAWVPMLSEFKELNVFCDELTVYSDLILKLPYGILSLIVMGLQDIISGDELDIDRADWETYTKVYYFLSGVLLTKKDKKLEFTNDDVDSLQTIVSHMITRLSLLEGYFAGVLDARFIETNDGEGWRYGMNDDQFSEFVKRFRDKRV
jgi:hypothetical protein